jgi:hypothetical protein
MATVSDRSLFLEHIRTNPLTVKQIKEMFGVAENTARAWTSHDEVEQIPGSWPRQFKRKESFAEEIPVAPKKAIKSIDIIELPRISTEDKEAFFKRLMSQDPPKFEFTEMFREALTVKHLEMIENRLIQSIIITRYYKQLMLDEEMD